MANRDTQYDDEEDTDTITLVEPPQGLDPPAITEEVIGATITVLTGPAAGRLYVLKEHGGSMGRGAGANVVLDDSTVSRVHARLELEEGVWILRDLDSRNGTFVDGMQIDHQPRPLANSCKIGLGIRVLLSFTAVDRLGAEAAEQIAQSLRDDPLTGLGNRSHLERRLHEEVSFARRHGQPLGALMLDLDHFKRINDLYGHQTGDRVLRAVGQSLLRTIRIEDTAFRYGGEEFCILVRGIQDVGLVAMAERIRVAVEELHPIEEDDLPVTISIGVSALRPDIKDPGHDLIQRADRALYRAKAAGRNRVVVYTDGARPDPLAHTLAALPPHQGFSTSLPPIAD